MSDDLIYINPVLMTELETLINTVMVPDDMLTGGMIPLHGFYEDLNYLLFIYVVIKRDADDGEVRRILLTKCTDGHVIETSFVELFVAHDEDNCHFKLWPTKTLRFAKNQATEDEISTFTLQLLAYNADDRGLNLRRRSSILSNIEDTDLFARGLLSLHDMLELTDRA